MAIVRAHVTALGGNAMVAYFMNECILLNNPHKNQVSSIKIFIFIQFYCCIAKGEVLIQMTKK